MSTEFFDRLDRIDQSRQARSVILHGNIYDLFRSQNKYVPLMDCLIDKYAVEGRLRVIYELNSSIRILAHGDAQPDFVDNARQPETKGHAILRDAWVSWKLGKSANDQAIAEMLNAVSKKPQTTTAARSAEDLKKDFDRDLNEVIGKPSLALEYLRQFAMVSRSKYLKDSLVFLIEAADMLIPLGRGEDLASLRDNQLRRIIISQDWLSDPDFSSGPDFTVLLAESKSLIHPRVSRLPQVLSVEIPSPDRDGRLKYINHFMDDQKTPPQLWSSREDLAAYTAGLSLHALRQLLAGATHSQEKVSPKDLIGKVEEFIQSQVGEDVVEFKKPTHTLDHVVGASNLKSFLKRELIPRFKADPEKALPGAAVAGPIGGGKTFIFEAMAGELGVPVLVLKSIRSQWYGQTDVIFERLRRVLEALDKVVIFVDEADTQFGGVGAETHSTERRLTGKIQAMMSDPKLRGKVMWLLMTARIHLLSPDIRRPGRVGDLIIPVLDPQGDDRNDFLRWVLGAAMENPTDEDVARMDDITKGYSAAAFASLRSQIKASDVKDVDRIVEVVRDQIPPNIGLTRRYQTLQAMLNCTRRSLMPDPNFTDADREAWQSELTRMEQHGIR